jgi:hypothetical protein
MIINEIKTFLKLLFSIPSVIVFAIYSALKTYRMYRKGEIDINNRVEVYKEMSNIFEETKEQGYHINTIFWILILFIITK